jgi:hypothetical protein
MHLLAATATNLDEIVNAVDLCQPLASRSRSIGQIAGETTPKGEAGVTPE